MQQDKKAIYTAVQKVFDQLLPKVTTALRYKTPFQLLVATIMSAQCTDVLVNKVTEKLFKKYKGPKDFANASLTQLRKDIYPVTFYKNKAVSLQKTAKLLLSDFDGKVPKNMPDLLKLSGVARKTANVVLGHAYGISSGIVVDTHVKRVAKRLGLTTQTDPTKIEQELIAVVPKKNWIKFADQMIWYGRKFCTAKVDKCAQLGIKLKHYSI